MGKKSNKVNDFVDKALIYRKYPYVASILRFFEAEMIRKHLDRLMSKGLVPKKDGKFLKTGEVKIESLMYNAP